MIKKLLFTLLTLLTLNLFAQTETITIDWSFNSTPSASGNANTDRTIEVGDTVQWNWYASGSHNVVSSSGSTETFSSGSVTSNPGINFSYTFTQVGTNPFVCAPHSGSMFGTITVVANGTLSVNSFEDILTQINVYPNPVSTQLNVNIPSKIKEGVSLEIYNVLGKRIMVKDTNDLNNTLNISDLSNGVYLLKISLNTIDKSITKRFVKI